MEPWQKLLQALCEIWVEEEILLGKFDNEKEHSKAIIEGNRNSSEEQNEAA